MGLPKNWEKELDSEHEEVWFNRRTSMKLVLEKSGGENFVYEVFAHPALDGTDIPGSPFSNQDEAREAAVMYMEDHKGRTGNVESASTILQDLHPGDPVSKPEMEAHVEQDGVWFSINTYYLLNHLVERDESCLMIDEMMERYDKQKNANQVTQMSQIAGEDVENTYNYHDKLEPTSTISFVLCDFTPSGEPEPIDDIYDARYIILRLHQGGDVRGSYRGPTTFKISDPAMLITGLHDVGARTVDEDGDRLNWHSDDGGVHWYEGDGEGSKNWRFDEENDKVFYKPSGAEIEFSSMATR